MTYKQALAFLDSLVNYEKQPAPRTEFKLDNIRRLLALAGNPQDHMPPVVLVAGTKGKGSVCYMLESALRGCGTRTGMFVSPHVLDVRERIQLNGQPISPRLFASTLSRLARFVRTSRSSPAPSSSLLTLHSSLPAVSYFELTAAMAFSLFARKKPDYCIIEVGLGGRLDATNLCDPHVSVITRIGYDHLNVLGRTLPKIAREKAGIMRSGRPVVISTQEPSALAALRRSASLAGARLIRSSSVRLTDLRTSPSGSSFSASFLTPHSSLLTPLSLLLPLLGAHQVENCRTALAVLSLLARSDPRITARGIKRGIAGVAVPARCQIVQKNPLVIVDSCHNPESGQALADCLRTHILHPRVPSTDYHFHSVVLVFGSLKGKLVARTVAPLAPLVRKAILVRPDSPRAMPLPRLKAVFTRLRIPHVSAPDIPSALALARRSSSSPGLPATVPRQPSSPRRLSFGLEPSSFPVVVAGSFYLAGSALRLLTRHP